MDSWEEDLILYDVNEDCMTEFEKEMMYDELMEGDDFDV